MAESFIAQAEAIKKRKAAEAAAAATPAGQAAAAAAAKRRKASIDRANRNLAVGKRKTQKPTVRRIAASGSTSRAAGAKLADVETRRTLRRP